MMQAAEIKVSLVEGYYVASYSDEDGTEYEGTGDNMSDALYVLAEDLAWGGL